MKKKWEPGEKSVNHLIKILGLAKGSFRDFPPFITLRLVDEVSFSVAVFTFLSFQSIIFLSSWCRVNTKSYFCSFFCCSTSCFYLFCFHFRDDGEMWDGESQKVCDIEIKNSWAFKSSLKASWIMKHNPEISGLSSHKAELFPSFIHVSRDDLLFSLSSRV